MILKLSQVLKLKVLNQWGLFVVCCAVMSVFNLLAMAGQNIATPEGVSHMIGYSVRWAVPFIYLAIAASAIKILFKGALSNWLLRNRKYIGLVFGFAMAWQAVFIYILSSFHVDYYYSDVYVFRDELEGSIGYIFLTAMILTSFNIARKKITQKQWTLIQKSGVYFLWAYPFSVYWWNLFYYPFIEGGGNPELHDYVFYVAGFIVVALRIFAWGKLRLLANQKAKHQVQLPSGVKFFGSTLVVIGLIVSATGHYWFEPVTTVLSGPQWAAQTSLWLPFWPLEPFFSLIIIGAGTAIKTGRGYVSSTIGSSGRAN